MSFDLKTYKQAKTPVKDIKIDIRSGFAKGFPEKRKELFYRELGMLLKSGVDFKKALEILSSQSKNRLEADLINNIKKKVVEGKSINDAMMSSGYFSPYEYYSVQIGEETRKLELVLEELQKFFNRKIQMKRQIISVLTYPSIVMLVTLLVLYFMLNKVVPMFSSVFKQFGGELPAITRYIIKISNHSGMLFISFLVLIISFTIIHNMSKHVSRYRAFTSVFVMKIPFFGNLIRKIYLSRFCQAMSLLTSSKTSLISSLTLTSKMIGFYPLEHSIEEIKYDVTKGMSFSDSLKKHPVYEQKMISMIDVAEQVNQLDAMFERLTEQYNEEISHHTKMIGVVLEPMIIIVIGIIVGVIMVSMYAPMFDLSKIINN